MPIRGVYFVSHKGDLLVSHTSETAANVKMLTEIFRIEVILSRKNLGAMLKLDEKPTWLSYIEAHEIFLIVVVEGNDGSASNVLRFLRDFHDLCVSQFGVLSVKNVNDNIVWIQSILHSALTGGITQSIDKGIIEAVSKKSLEGMSNTIIQSLPPRETNVKSAHSAKNEAVFESISKFDMTLSQNREILFHNVLVDVMMKSSLHSAKKHQLTMIGIQNQAEVQSASFHPCVDLASWRHGEKIDFFPPASNEPIKLLSFQAPNQQKIVPFLIHSFEREARGNTRVEIEFRLRANFSSQLEAQSIVIGIPCPPTTSTVNVYHRKGRAKYKPERGLIRWKIPTMAGQSEEVFSAEIVCIPPTDGKRILSHQPPISVSFEIPSYNCTGIRQMNVRNLQFGAEEIRSTVRFTARSGKYECRVE